ncbi:MAG: class I SAM-dependent methyltransferase [Simkaniaceae bacterium]|nr:class I SAM-dependent methyltransferase [Simkaniaceae bacterium]
MSYTKLVFVFIMSLNCLMHAGQVYPRPYSSLEKILPYRTTLGTYYSNGIEIERIFNTHKIVKALEVGSFLGTGSTAHIAKLMKSRANAKLYAVDHWLGSYNHQVGGTAYDPILPKLYDQFLSNMVHLGLTKIVVPIRMDSVEASKFLNETFDFIYIDAEHLEEFVYNDLVAWYPHLNLGGVFCGDDWGTCGDVRNAVRRFASENNLEIFTGSNFWRLLKKGEML